MKTHWDHKFMYQDKVDTSVLLCNGYVSIFNIVTVRQRRWFWKENTLAPRDFKNLKTQYHGLIHTNSYKTPTSMSN